MKTCRTCLLELPLEQFGSDKTRKDAKCVYCKQCFKKRQKDNYHKNRDKWLANNQRWKSQNRERYLKSQAKYYQKNKALVKQRISKWNARHKSQLVNYNNKRRITLESNKFLVFEKDIRKILNQPCFYCKTTPATTIDHIIPVAKGGRHSVGNLIGACRPCNSSKKTKTIMEFRVWKSNQIVI